MAKSDFRTNQSISTSNADTGVVPINKSVDYPWTAKRYNVFVDYSSTVFWPNRPRIVQGQPEIRVFFSCVLAQPSADYPRTARDTRYSWITFPQCSDTTILRLSKDDQRYSVLLFHSVLTHLFIDYQRHF